jgi:hypothetical protein
MLRSPSVSSKPVAEADFDRSAFDDKKFHRRVALVENDIASVE